MGEIETKSFNEQSSDENQREPDDGKLHQGSRVLTNRIWALPFADIEI